MRSFLVSLFVFLVSILPIPFPTLAQAPINVNSATAEQLDQLPGIGPSRAAAIVAARTRRPFRRLTDLLRVPGIGRVTLQRLAPYVRFEDPVVPAPPSASTEAR